MLSLFTEYTLTVSTPGGTEFDVQWRDGDAGADPVMLEDMFIKEHHKNPNESESDDFMAAFSEREMAAWLEKLKHKNLGFLVGALGNATTLDGIAAREAAGQRSGTGLSISASAIKISKQSAARTSRASSAACDLSSVRAAPRARARH